MKYMSTELQFLIYFENRKYLATDAISVNDNVLYFLKDVVNIIAH